MGDEQGRLKRRMDGIPEIFNTGKRISNHGQERLISKQILREKILAATRFFHSERGAIIWRESQKVFYDRKRILYGSAPMHREVVACEDERGGGSKFASG